MATTVCVAASLVGKCVVMLDPHRWHSGVWTVVGSWHNCTVVGRGGKGLMQSLLKRPRFDQAVVEWEKGRWVVETDWLEHVHVRGEDGGVWHWKGMVVCRTVVVGRVVGRVIVVGRRNKWERGEASACTPIKATRCGIWAIKVWDAQ